MDLKQGARAWVGCSCMHAYKQADHSMHSTHALHVRQCIHTGMQVRAIADTNTSTLQPMLPPYLQLLALPCFQAVRRRTQPKPNYTAPPQPMLPLLPYLQLALLQDVRLCAGTCNLNHKQWSAGWELGPHRSRSSQPPS